MKIHEILVESQQLDEGPLLNKIGSGIGKFAGTTAGYERSRRVWRERGSSPADLFRPVSFNRRWGIFFELPNGG